MNGLFKRIVNIFSHNRKNHCTASLCNDESMKRRALIIHSEDRKENSDRLLQVANGKRKFLYYHLQEPLSRDDDMAIIHKDIMSGIVLDAYFSHKSQ